MVVLKANFVPVFSLERRSQVLRADLLEDGRGGGRGGRGTGEQPRAVRSFWRHPVYFISDSPYKIYMVA